jgi:uncharacterized protein YdaU (DUF1376 family)
MAALPYMQLYVADYLADTAHLNAEEHGAYLLLLMNYWQRGKPLPDSNDRLATVARTLNDRWTTVRKALEEFFEIRDGFWYHKRIERDLEKVNSQASAASRAGKASAKARLDKKMERPFNDRSTTVQRRTEQPLNHTDTDTDTDTDKSKTLAPSAKALEASAQVTALVPLPPPEPIIGTIPLVDGSQFGFTQADVSGWCDAYPAVNVMGELKQMREHAKANPQKRKTPKGIRRFITAWLAREQDKPTGGTYGIRPDTVLERQRQNFQNIAAAGGFESADGAGGGFLSKPDTPPRDAGRLLVGVASDR